MFHAEAGVDCLLREYLDGKELVTAVQAAFECHVHSFGVVVAHDDILGFNAFHALFLLLTLLDIAMLFAIFGNGMAPELTAAAGFLADFELDTLFLFVFRKLHRTPFIGWRNRLVSLNLAKMNDKRLFWP